MQANSARNLKTVDALEVTVLVDNVVDALSTLPKGVKSDTAVLLGKGLKVSSGHARCCANNGLSLVVAARMGSDIQILLFDTGPEAYTIARNGDRLKTPFGEVGAIVLSHGHWDHGGGLPEAIRLVTSANGGKPVPCHVNDGMFVSRAVRLPNGSYLPHEDLMRPAQLAKAGAAVVSSGEARLIVEQMFYLSGEIPRVTPYEKGYPPHMKLAADGASWEPDPWIMDERYVAAHVRDKGIVIFTACSHAGVVNVLTDARRVFGDVPLHAVMGGFHLAGAEVEKIIPDTVRDMQGFNLKRIVPCHCTGWRAVRALTNALSEDIIVPAAVGREFVF